MSRALTPQLIARRHTLVRKHRELPLSGQILVQVGDYVKADQVVGRAELPGELFIVRTVEQTGLEPPEVMQHLKVAVGEKVEVGSVLCLHPGPFGGAFSFLRTECHSPIEGTVEFISAQTGHIGIRAPSIPLELPAYIPGRVVRVEERKSVLIETEAMMLQGIFGVGGERLGSLHLMSVPPDKEVDQTDIPPDCMGKVLVGGMCPTPDALLFAQARGAVGFVTGSIDDRALHRYLGFDLGVALTGDEPVSMTVVVTEGFGKMPLSGRVMELLRPFEGKVASINGATQVRAGAQRPEVIVKEQDSAQPAEAHTARGLTIGAKIRIIRVPFFGQSAVVTELPQELVKVASGAETRVVVARLSDGNEVTIPRANVELL